MLTTEMPVAQLLSMARSAVRPTETGAVADARGHRDDRHVDEPADDARQRAFHSGDDDDDARGGQPGVLVEQPMQTGDADVVEPIDRIAHDFGGNGRFFGDRQVGGAGGGNEDRPAAARRVLKIERDTAAPARDTQRRGRSARTAR